MKKIQTIVTVLLAVMVLGPISLSAQNTYDLGAVLEYAKAHNPQLNMARLNTELADKQTDEAMSALLPQINGVLSSDYNAALATQLLPAEIFGGSPGEFQPVTFGTKYNTNAQIQLNQVLFNPQITSGLKLAKENTKVKELETAQQFENIAYNLSLLYINAVILENEIEVLETQQQTLKTTLTETQVRVDNGVMRAVDLHRLEVNYNNLSSSLNALNRSYDQTVNQLKFTMGLSQSAELTLEPFDLQSGEQTNEIIPATTQEDLSKRLDLKILDKQVEILDLNRKMNLAGYLPTVSVYARGGLNNQQNDLRIFSEDSQWYESAVIGVQVNVPIFDGLAKQAKNKQQKIQMDILDQNERLTLESADLAVGNAEIRIRNAIASLESEERNMELAKEVLSVTRLEYSAGSATASILVEAENSLTESQTNYSRSLLELYLARIDLEYARGTLLSFLNL